MPAARDDWLTPAMRHDHLLEIGERELLDALMVAQRRYLTQVRRAVLDTTTVVRAAAGDDEPPNLDRWPDLTIWRDLLIELVTAVVKRLYRRYFAR